MKLSKAVIYQGELDYMARCVMDYPEIETGGDLFGFWTHSGYPVIQYVIGPGPKANHQVAFFNQDGDWLETSGKLLREAHGLQHIGQWHSHHKLGLAEPSSHDVSTVVRAIGLYELKQFLLVITNIRNEAVTINGFLLRREEGRNVNPSGWVVLDGDSPARKTFDLKCKSVVYKPRKKRAFIESLKTVGLEEQQFVKPQYRPDYWLTEKENHRALKEIMNGLEESYGGVALYMNDPDKTVYLEFSNNNELIRLDFPLGFPEIKPIISVPILETDWQINNGIVKATIDYVKKHLEHDHREIQ